MTHSLTSRAAVAGCVAALAAACGCGGDGYRYAPVSGRVTLDGTPVPGALVSFQPDAGGALEAGKGSVGKTDTDGRFTLRVIGNGAGARVGHHRVGVSKSDIKVNPDDIDKPGVPVPKEIFPRRYNAETDLQFDVPPAGTAEANFDLTTK